MSDNVVASKRHIKYSLQQKLIEDWLSRKRDGVAILTEDEQYMIRYCLECVDTMDLIEQEITFRSENELADKDPLFCDGFNYFKDMLKTCLLGLNSAEHKKARMSDNPYADMLEEIQNEIETGNQEYLQDETCAKFYESVFRTMNKYKEKSSLSIIYEQLDARNQSAEDNVEDLDEEKD